MTLLRLIRQIVILVLIAQACEVLWAQEQVDLLQDLEEVKDPFRSQLPEPVVIVNTPVGQPVDDEPEDSGGHDPVDPSTFVPDVPVVVRGPNIDAFVLKGLIWNTDNPQAIVNDKVVKVGDEVNGIKVVAIRQDGVEFSQNGINRSLRISNQTGAVAPKP